MTAAPDPATDTAPDHTLLHLDVAMVLVECHRDRVGDGIFRPDATRRDLEAFAAVMARCLAPKIGGRYVPKRDVRAARDAEVMAAFTGANHQDVMRKFKISRRLLYSILSRRRKRG